MSGKFEGKVVFITGAARGQGRSHAVRFAEEGADIIAIDICEEIPAAPYAGATEEDLAETVRQVEALDRRIIATKADIRDFDGLKAAVDAGVAELGRLDIVCANAGIYTTTGPVEEFPVEIWKNMIDTNLNGQWNTVKVTVPHIKAGGRGGSVILTSSGAGLEASPSIGHYSTAKHGVVGLMRTLAAELGPEYIRVNSIHQTQVNTPMIHTQATYDLFAPDIENPGRDVFEERSKAINAIPVPWVESIDVSNAHVFLASDDARYITGATLPVDAGHLLK